MNVDISQFVLLTETLQSFAPGDVPGSKSPFIPGISSELRRRSKRLLLTWISLVVEGQCKISQFEYAEPGCFQTSQQVIR